MGNVKVSASILSADLGNLLSESRRAVECGADWVHMDVMDGHFVPNLTFGAPLVASLKGRVEAPIHSHLMITDPDKYIPDFAKAGSTWIDFHIEASKDSAATIKLIRSLGCKPGVAVQPGTSEDAVKPFARDLDLVVFMTVNAGFAGQSFMPEVVPKIARFSAWCKQQGISPEIGVDGGVGPKNASQVIGAGATVIVAATALFKAPDMREAIASIKNAGTKP